MARSRRKTAGSGSGPAPPDASPAGKQAGGGSDAASPTPAPRGGPSPVKRPPSAPTSAGATSSLSSMVLREGVMLVVAAVALAVLFLPYNPEAALPLAGRCLGLYLLVRCALFILVVLYRVFAPYNDVVAVAAFVGLWGVLFVWRPSVQFVATFLNDAVGPDASSFFKEGFKQTRYRFLMASLIVFVGFLVFFAFQLPYMLVVAAFRAVFRRRVAYGSVALPADPSVAAEEAEAAALEASSGDDGEEES